MKQTTVSYIQAVMSAVARRQTSDANLVGLLGAIGNPEEVATELSTAFAGWTFPTPQKKQDFKRLCKRHFQTRFPGQLLRIKGNHATVTRKGNQAVTANGDTAPDTKLKSNRQLEAETAKLERENRELLGMVESSVPQEQASKAVNAAVKTTETAIEQLQLQVQRLEREKAVMADEYSIIVAGILDKTVTRATLREMVAA